MYCTNIIASKNIAYSQSYALEARFSECKTQFEAIAEGVPEHSFKMFFNPSPSLVIVDTSYILAKVSSYG